MKVRVSLGTSVEVRGRWYRASVTIEDSAESFGINSFEEFEAVARAKADDIGDALQPILVDKLSNLVDELDDEKFVKKEPVMRKVKLSERSR